MLLARTGNHLACILGVLLITISLSERFSGPTVVMAADSECPDIVVFLSDDHTFRDSSVYGPSDIETPNMSRLAEAVITFDQAFVASPSCAPSRAALLTGFIRPATVPSRIMPVPTRT